MIRHRGTGYPCQRAQAVPSVGVAKEKFCERHTHFLSLNPQLLAHLLQSVRSLTARPAL